MRGAVIHAPGDVRFETLDDPKILQPTDAIIRTAVTCVCGSDLWPFRGLDTVDEPHPMGHEYLGFLEEVGSEVTAVKPGQFVHRFVRHLGQHLRHCRNGCGVRVEAGLVVAGGDVGEHHAVVQGADRPGRDVDVGQGGLHGLDDGRDVVRGQPAGVGLEAADAHPDGEVRFPHSSRIASSTSVRKRIRLSSEPP
ncbi:L-threonine 3-dehydrogenase [Streptomyces hirsutus]